MRAGALEAHYTDAGVLPRDAVADALWRPLRFSVYFAVGDHRSVAVLFGLQALLALLLTAGLRTRVVTVASWLLLVSLQNRNVLILNAGDTLLRLLLFWGMFLPLGARFSLDARRGRTREQSDVALSAATAAFTFQLCVVYWCSAVLKTDPSWTDGTALFYALHVDLMAKPAGLWLRELGPLHAPLTRVALVWEWVGPLLLFVPVRSAAPRLLAAAGFAAFHLGIFLLLDVGLFSFVCITAWLAMLPGGCWGRRTAGALQPGRRQAVRSGVVANLLAAACCLYMLVWNLRSLDTDRWGPYFPRAWNVIGDLLRLDQKWNMFAPGPPVADGWFVVAATLADGEEVDLRTGEAPPSFDKPPLVTALIGNRRWGKYLMRLRTRRYAQHRERYANYLARAWNAAHGPERHVETVDLYFVREATRPDGPGPPQPVRLARVRRARSQ